MNLDNKRAASKPIREDPKPGALFSDDYRTNIVSFMM